MQSGHISPPRPLSPRYPRQFGRITTNSILFRQRVNFIAYSRNAYSGGTVIRYRRMVADDLFTELFADRRYIGHMPVIPMAVVFFDGRLRRAASREKRPHFAGRRRIRRFRFTAASILRRGFYLAASSAISNAGFLSAQTL